VPAELDRTFEALSDPTRLAVVDLLGKKPLRSSDIARALALSRPVTSRHLGVLRRAGLVTETALEEDARVRVYRLRAEPFGDLRRWLEHVESFWSAQLGAFKAHAERKHERSRR
jgi:DNA-binding transcriptional ArsR family regulator